jgi:hypothetical protein
MLGVLTRICAIEMSSRDRNEQPLENLIYRMENWGYFLLPRSHPRCPGYTGLLVAIREKPTEKHFDPEALRLSLLDQFTMPGPTTLTLHTSLARSRRVLPGSVVVRDRLNKQEEFFTFGGTLESVAVPGETVYSLRSAAPVLWLAPEGDSVADQLAGEFGRLLGELRAVAKMSETDLRGQLMQIGPQRLYVASICSMLADYERNPSLRECYHEFDVMLHEEKEWLEEAHEWPTKPLALEQLLAPNQDAPGR